MLFTKEIKKEIPALYEQDGKGGGTTVYIKVTMDYNKNFVWMITEYDQKEKLFFGFVCLDDLQNAELGYISEYELESMAKQYPMTVEKINMSLNDAKAKFIND